MVTQKEVLVSVSENSERNLEQCRNNNQGKLFKTGKIRSVIKDLQCVYS